MEYTTYVVEGQTLVDNIHRIKTWVYDGTIRIHIPVSSFEAVEQSYRESREPKELPKEEKLSKQESEQKRQSGRARKGHSFFDVNPRTVKEEKLLKEEPEQKVQSGRPRKEYPLFDINPRTAKEFLERAKSEIGLTGVSFQGECGEKFSQWEREDDEQAQAIAQPQAPPSSFSEALLSKLNIVQPAKDESGLPKPRLVAKHSYGRSPSPTKYRQPPMVNRQTIPEALRPTFSAALWKVHEFDGDPLDPESYALLTQDPSIVDLAYRCGLPCVLLPALRQAIHTRFAEGDQRENAGLVEADFPDGPQHTVPLIPKAQPQPSQETNDHSNSHAQSEHRLEATALSTIEELLGGIVDNTNSLSTAQSPSAELRPSISYAMAAGATSLPNGTSVSASLPVSEAGKEPISQPEKSTNNEQAKPILAKVEMPEEDSDEEVVVFTGKKRRSQEVRRASRPASRPATAAGVEKLASPKAGKAILESSLKPQSPVFTPGQLYTPTSPIQPPVQEVQPTSTKKRGSPVRRSSPPKSEGGASPNVRAKAQLTPQTPRGANVQARRTASEDAQRQSEIILQRQREAIKRSAQLQENQASRAQQEAKALPREVDMKPTSNPVVIDPDDFGRDYTIRPMASEHANGRSKGSARRGGRGRGGKTQHQQQPTQQDNGKKEVDFVLKSGNPRNSTRGKGKLWVP